MVSRLVFGIVLAMAGGGQHPEWGPEPPVAPYGMEPLPSEHVVVPLIFPVLGKPRWFDDYGTPRSGFLHTGIDIRAPKMTPIVAPFGGTLGMKKESFWIFADNGWAMLGTHLNDDNPGKHDHAAGRDFMFAPGLQPNQRVHSGQFIGYVGESGDATAPHLHFEIYAPGPPPVQSRIRDPFFSLKAAQVITAPVVVAPSPRPPKGSTRIQGCVRKIEAAQHRLTLIVAAREFSTGETVAVTHVRYLRVRVPDAVVAQVGGWITLSRVGAEDLIGVFLPDSPKLDDATATRILPY